MKNGYGEWLRKRDLTIVILMFELALRPKECLALRFDDFEPQNMFFRIRAENNKERQAGTIPLTEKVIPYLEKYLSLPRARFWRNSPYLFPSFSNRHSHVSSERWKHKFREILKEAGIWEAPVNSTRPPYSSYTLRHTKATMVLEKTKDIRLVQLMLRHKDPRSTQVYHHITKSYVDYLRKAMNGP